MTVNGDYFIGVHDRELARLEHQHAAWRPETEALWARAGFGPGQHIADLGSGPGFAAFDLAALVGSEGRIAALDKASPFLRFVEAEAARRRLANVYTLEADLTKAEALGQRFDGAFCRFLLAFLIDDLDRALQCIYRSLEPGGVFAAMEYLTLASATCSPPIRGFDAHTQAWVEYYRSNGGDTSVGTYLPRKLSEAGFDVTHIECVGGMARPGERWWSWWGRLMADFGERLVAESFMPPEALRDLETEWQEVSSDPGAFIYTPVLVQIVARKPRGIPA
jgi:ubiquinone/menaquinone biosynthesis C-methylase UbiE